jgi:hypothetical protein
VRNGYAVWLLAATVAWLTGAGPAFAFNPLPMRLPPSGAYAAGSSVPSTWLLGIRPTVQAHELAAKLGAKRVTDNAVVISTSRAREAAKQLRKTGALSYAEPNVRRQVTASYDGFPDQWARGAVVPPATISPPLGQIKIGVVDDRVDITHPDLAGHTTIVADEGRAAVSPHGTEVASIAAGSAGNGGVMGVLPGAPVLAFGSDLYCSDVAGGILSLMEAGVGVINMSIGSSEPCAAENAAIQKAIGEGVVIVAAAGNEFEAGNAVQYPAAYAHVLSVASVRYPDLASSYFSNANAAVDVSAPGENVPVAIPLAFDVEDGAQDGVTTADGTSFASPIVAGVAAWISTVRPSLTAIQVADTLRQGAIDLGPKSWDPDYGYGLVSLPGALSAPDPFEDPLEPNDDIPLVDGTYFGIADRPIYTGSARRRLFATVDFAEDPYDVYRIRIPARRAVKIEVRPSYGDPDLYTYGSRARSIYQGRRILARSVRSRGTDRVDLKNSNRRGSVLA